ncbi:MAG: hypothetical protein JSW40_07935 [Candidatus Omnitrophota bacterium]|nr:MAG: hypothetical protein JSW40_07935 [Candidatus Omnitrophota bacterium]
MPPLIPPHILRMLNLNPVLSFIFKVLGVGLGGVIMAVVCDVIYDRIERVIKKEPGDKLKDMNVPVSVCGFIVGAGIAIFLIFFRR